MLIRSTRKVTRRGLMLGTLSAAGSALAMPAILRRALAQPVPPTRLPAHLLTLDHPVVLAFQRAVLALRGTAWNQIAKQHQFICAANLNTNAHYNWRFLPWHRAFLVLVEWQMQQASGDPTFAIPYWDWYRHPTLPAIFTDDPVNNPLVHAKRAVGAPSDNQAKWERLRPDDESRTVAWDSFLDFGSGPMRVGADGMADAQNQGILERYHSNAHAYVGGDMGNFATAAFDPIFFSHHANVDRMWQVWTNSAIPSRPHQPPGGQWSNEMFSFAQPDGGILAANSNGLLDPTDLRFTLYGSSGTPTYTYGYRYDRDRLDGPLPPRILARGPESLGQPGAGAGSIPLNSGGAPLRLTAAPLIARPVLARPESLGASPDRPLPEGIRVYIRLEGIEIPSDVTTIITALRFSGDRRAIVEVDSVLPIGSGSAAGSFGTTTDITDALREAGVGIAGFAVEMTARRAQGDASLAFRSFSILVR